MANRRSDVSSHPTSGEVQTYLESYCDHFNLHPRIRLRASIRNVIRDEEAKKWILDIEGRNPETFDKVVIANGMNQLPKQPRIPGMELFTGTAIHSRSFKRHLSTETPL
jgi:dimethylaniline monooxygenase (N-oxide forming)